jgi:DNA-directed RNA polymerase subunit RPC12/RpoP
MSKRIRLSALIAVAISLVVVSVAFAQADRVQLSLSKISGIGLGGQIQGLFQLSVSGNSSLTAVTYYLDGKEMGTVSQSPYSLQFYTDSYTPGQHQFTATGRTSGGQTLGSNTITAEIVSFSQGWTSVVRLLWPILIVVIIVLGVGIAVPLLSARSGRHYEPGAERNYGVVGGTICGRCGRPYALSFFSLRLLVGRLSRCPYCGKWALARPASREALRAAEHAELQNAPVVHEESPEQKLKKKIEESRMAR